AGMNTSAARSRLARTIVSPSRRAIMTLVSSRNLPFAGIDTLAVFLDRLGHLPRRNRVYSECELLQACAALTRRSRGSQGNHEPQHLFLRFRREHLYSPGDLLPDIHLLVLLPSSRI